MAQDSLNRRGRLRTVGGPRLVLRDPEDELPPNPDYTGVGAVLRGARRQAGLSVEDIAVRLRIRRDYLKAIERGDFSALPGASYALGFVRSYAEYLRLDGVRAVEAYKDETGGPQIDGPLSFPAPAAEQRLPRFWLVVVALILAGGIYVYWAGRQEQLFAIADRVPPVPERILSAAPPPALMPAPIAPASPPVVVPPAAEVAPPADGSAVAVPPPVATVPVEPPSDLAPPPIMAAVPPPPPLPQVTPQAVEVPPPKPPGLYGSEQADVRVTIHATERAWIRVAGPQGQTLFQRILEPGETYRVPNQPDLVMDAGNLGGIDLTVDGKPIPPLGGSGVPKRNIALAPATLLERRVPAN